jgi:superfamily II DNA or RNA helicase
MTVPDGTYVGQYGYTILKKNITEEQLANIKDDLTVKPCIPSAPKGAANKKIFYAFRYTPKKIFVPYYYGISKFGIPTETRLPEGEPIVADFSGELRPKQVPVVNAYMTHIKSDEKSGGLLELPCAFGKTCLAMYIISLLKTKTLIIVHKTFLLNQWIARITEFLPGVKIGRIQGNVVDIEGADIVIGMLQSLSMKEYPKGTFDCFGLTIIDEVHHISSETFSKSLFNIVTKYTLGLSATMNRKDGTSRIFKMFLGDVRFKGKREHRDVKVKCISYTSPDPVFNAIEYDQYGNPSYSTLVTKICNYIPRSNFIIQVIEDMMTENPSQQLMAICTNKSLVHYILDTIKAKGVITVGKYIGGMKESALDESAEKQLIVATYAQASEGLDIKTLTTLLMATPRTDIEQTVGRILRDQDSLPEVVDIIDPHRMFISQSTKRKRFFKEEGYSIDTISSKAYFNTPRKWVRRFTPTKCGKNASIESDDEDDPNKLPDTLTGTCYFTDKMAINK